MKKQIFELLNDAQYYRLDNRVNLFNNQSKNEFFLVTEYSEKNFKNFFSSPQTSLLLEEFKKIKSDENLIHAEKNTSLIILVEVDDLKEKFTLLKNTILSVEEDIYFFRKFVILYTNDSTAYVQNVIDESNFYETLDAGINDFEKNMYFDSNYFVLMEIAIKLPFLVVKQSDELYRSIDDKFGLIEYNNLDDYIIKSFTDESELFEGNEDFKEIVDQIVFLDNKEIEHDN